MKQTHYLISLALCLSLLSHTARAAEIQVSLEIPKIDAAEYHRPYVAVWLENEHRKQLQHLALWLEQEKWHRDLRSWWRRGGRSQQLPVDGVSGATRKPSTYQLQSHYELINGNYSLNIEAVREVGGREHIRIPFHWTGQQQTLIQVGNSELGEIRITIVPEIQP